ncbi:hypothetical protein VTL71DRAFT_10339 [Oculimacula yallundae]|uniref:Uncharacterized protein n=1 Tax=Oculimacula yallundae TaxID=86028 RepID=A0ABR4CT31_9HELO
MTFSTSYSRR